MLQGLLMQGQYLPLLLEGEFSIGRLVISLVIGLVIALVAKAGMSNVQPGKNASYYVRENSLDLHEKKDIFLYTKTTSTKINDD